MFLQTERLYLRCLRSEDVPVIYSYRNDPDCAKFQRWEDPSYSSVADFVKKFSDCHFLSQQEEQHYAICMHSGIFVGDLSYFYTESDHCITFGITIAPDYQRQGIAREILTAVISAVQKSYSQMDIVALIDPENKASIALFEKLGFYRECYAPSIRSYVYKIDGSR